MCIVVYANNIEYVTSFNKLNHIIYYFNNFLSLSPLSSTLI